MGNQLESLLLGRQVKLQATSSVPPEHVDKICIIQTIYYCSVSNVPKYVVLIPPDVPTGDGSYQNILLDLTQDDFLV